MDRVWWFRLVLVLGVTALAAWLLYPSVVFYTSATEAERQDPRLFCKRLPGWATCTKFNLGLDLQGGVHLVMGVVVEKAVQNRVDRIAEGIKDVLAEDKVEVATIFVPPPENALTAEGDVNLDLQASTEIHVTLAKPGDAEAAKKSIRKRFGSTVDLLVAKDDGALTFALASDEEEWVRTEAVEQAIKAIRNRADKLGVAEPTIAKRGTDNILIQLPGVKDPERAIDIIGRTAQLEFKIADDAGTTFLADLPLPADGSIKRDFNTYQGNKGQQVREVFLVGPDKGALLALVGDRVPPDRELAFEELPPAKPGEATRFRSYLLHRRAGITGDYLTDARIERDNETQLYNVSMEFDVQGAKIFEELTGAHVRERMAVVLDGVVNSAPVIKDRIGGGRARIELGGASSGQQNYQEAKDLVLVLKAGALPAPVIVREKRQVGESLGEDSVRAGRKALFWGFVLVIIFMALYYRLSGLLADLALLLNGVYILALMAMFEATLTMPGMAGIILTLAMAIDANVIINERIREELRLGKTPRAAVESGYGKAFWTIFDANVTTIIAGVVLLNYGSGPVKGFAVTMIAGLLASMFTAILVTRLVYDAILARRRLESLSI